MCLIKKSELKIAEKDLYVLKVLSSFKFDKQFGYSYYQDVRQSLNKLYKSAIVYELFSDYRIERGLHAIRIGVDTSFFRNLDLTTSYSTVICLAVIPKGSKYVIGGDGDIVSNQIIILEPLVSSTDHLEEKCSKSLKSKDGFFRLASKIAKSYYGKQKY